MKTKEIRDLIDFISKSGLNEVNIETEELKLSVKRDPDMGQVIGQVAAPSQPIAVAPSPSAEGATAEQPATSNLVEIKSPMIGTFYLSSNPDADPFVNIGDRIEKGQTVCIVEAMKLFNEIESDVSGTIVKMLVDNASPVEYDQPLFLVDPS